MAEKSTSGKDSSEETDIKEHLDLPVVNIEAAAGTDECQSSSPGSSKKVTRRSKSPGWNVRSLLPRLPSLSPRRRDSGDDMEQDLVDDTLYESLKVESEPKSSKKRTQRSRSRSKSPGKVEFLQVNEDSCSCMSVEETKSEDSPKGSPKTKQSPKGKSQKKSLPVKSIIKQSYQLITGSPKKKATPPIPSKTPEKREEKSPRRPTSLVDPSKSPNKPKPKKFQDGFILDDPTIDYEGKLWTPGSVPSAETLTTDDSVSFSKGELEIVGIGEAGFYDETMESSESKFETSQDSKKSVDFQTEKSPESSRKPSEDSGTSSSKKSSKDCSKESSSRKSSDENPGPSKE